MIERITAMIGDLARPIAIIASSVGAAWSAVVIAYRVENGNDGAIFIAAVFTGVGALYGFKAWEIAKTGKQSAEVEIAKTQAPDRKG